MLANIRNIQESNNIPLSKALSHDLGKVGLDIEMETGTERHTFTSKRCSS